MKNKFTFYLLSLLLMVFNSFAYSQDITLGSYSNYPEKVYMEEAIIQGIYVPAGFRTFTEYIKGVVRAEIDAIDLYPKNWT
ncbi:MAG: hypothetical protein PHO33_04340 [Clostridia bacterium]|nr:hypothetical protein [Clostridia bacterium]